MPVVTAVAMAGLGSVLLAGAAPAVAGVPSAGAGGWRKAIEVPGTAALNKGGDARTFSVSCAAAGSCAAGGEYLDASGNLQAFVVTEAGGRWRKAIEVPGTAALNKGGDARILSVSCAAAGSCAAGGVYIDGSGHDQAFVVNEANGRWRKAIEVPGTAALNKGDAAIVSVSCAAAGSCAAGGFYIDGSRNFQAFVVSEAGGRWRKAIEVPGTAALNKGGFAHVRSVSCAAAGSCAAGGDYVDGSFHEQAFVVNEEGGQWRTAIKVPGTAALIKGGSAITFSVSCAAAGSCAAGGEYLDASGNLQAFVVTEAGGRWRKAIEVPGTAALNTGGLAGVRSVSCAAAGSCAAGGFYEDGSRNLQAFVVTEAGGRWRTAVEVPGTAALNTGGGADVRSVSCAPPHGCAAGGDYTDGSGHHQAFVVTEAGGRWRKAIQVPGTAALNKGGDAIILSVSCARPHGCAAGGDYTDGSGHHQAFVVSKP
jgi:ketosteroid isomerase-like protein